MQKRHLGLMIMLGLAATILGCVATRNSQAVSFDGHRCVYPRTPGLVCGIAAALLTLTVVALGTSARDCDGIDELVTGRRRNGAVACSQKIAWLAALVATVMFLCGAAMKRGFSTSGHDRHGRSRFYYYSCTELKSELFLVASLLSVIATGFAVAAYVLSFRRTDEPAPGQFVEMEQPQWAQPYPSPPMAYPAPPPPQYGHGGYGPRQPAATP